MTETRPRSSRRPDLRRTAKRAAKRGFWQLERTLNDRGWSLQRLDEDTRRYARMVTSQNESVPLPDGALEHLSPHNPVLADLVRSYGDLDIPPAAPSLWTEEFIDGQVSLPWFRGDNAYVWQYRMHKNAADLKTYLTLLDVEKRDRLGLLKTLSEDGLFGAWTFEFGQRPPVSRDLLDSVAEINYLEAQIGLTARSELSVLDIGAGYGRLAHRMSSALSNLEAYDCIDGVAHSTFLCDYYLRFRDCPESVRVVRLDEHEKLRDHYTVAVNIHSFTESTLASVQWWMAQLAQRDVEWLLVVPNHDTEMLTTEADGTRLDFRSTIDDSGYKLVDHRPRHEDDELRELIDSHNHHFLFRRETS